MLDETEVASIPEAQKSATQSPTPAPPAQVQLDAPKPLTAMNRAQLGKEIDDLAKSINLKDDDMTAWILERYKKPITQLTQKEMIDFHGVLLGEQMTKQERFI